MFKAHNFSLVQSQAATIFTAIVMMVGARWFFASADVIHINANSGIVTPSANLWIESSYVSMLVNVGLILTTAVMMLILNQRYNLLGTVSTLEATIFFPMCMATPDLLVQLSTGILLCIILILCLFLLYDTYGNRNRTGNIYLIFLLLSGMTVTQYCYALYIPVFILGLGQMRIMGFKTLLAALLGIVSPWWVMLGCGIAGTDDIRFPELESLFASVGLNDTLHVFAAVAVTAVIAMVSWSANFMRMLSYNAHKRAYAGSITLVTLFTIIITLADYPNVCAYLPVLCMCAAYHFTNYIARQQRQVQIPAVATIDAIYAAIYLWRMFL